MKRVLVVAYYFPPDGGAGTQRAAKFCKYLPCFGWEPLVVTREREVREVDWWTPPDPSLLEECADSLRVFRVPTPGSTPSGPFSRRRPDRHRRWATAAERQISDIVRSERIDAVLITMSPFALAHIADGVRTRHGVPVVFDLRDPWALDGWPTYPTWLHWLWDRRFMRRTVRRAAGTIANTPEARRVLLRDVGRLDPQRVVCIPNGYDADDFESVPARQADGRFLIVHAGSLHSYVLYPSTRVTDRLKRMVKYRPEPIEPQGRTLRFLLAALRRLRDAGHPLGSKTILALVGDIDEATRKSVRDAGMEQQVQYVGYLPHKESLNWLQRADALFLPLHGLPKGCRSRIVPGKTYEYLASGRPILGCLPEGDARELVESPGGVCADPCDAEEIADALRRLYESSVAPKGDAANPRHEWVTQFERRALTQQLASFLDSVTSGAGNAQRSRLR